jgi:predicted transglutaminase-like cysteine proteinase
VRASLLALLLLGLLASGSATAAPPGALFGMLAVHAPSLAGLPQWRRALREIRAEGEVYRACAADPATCPSEQARDWQRFLAGLAGRPPVEQARAVNRYANRWPYRTDQQVWGRSDHWASPLDFLLRSGDCEDYAIMKYVSLRLLGVPAEMLRLVVLQDTARDLAHAVLTVTVGDATYVLDNLADNLARPAALPHYVPYYSVNEDDRWVHVSERSVVISAANP